MTAHPQNRETQPLDDEALDRWEECLNLDEEFQLLARHSKFELSCGISGPEDGHQTSFTIHIAPPGAARIERTNADDLTGPSQLHIAWSAASWKEFCRERPAPGHSDIVGLSRVRQDFKIEDRGQTMMRYLPTIRRVFEVGRQANLPSREHEDSSTNHGEELGSDADVVGRYVNLDIAGTSYRVFYEEAGSGRPLLCLHTAGSDARQFRFMMADKALTKQLRIIAIDFPYHGRSTPPDDWWTQEYLLTADQMSNVVEQFAARLNLERPIIMGCSMTGTGVLELARRSPDAYGGVLALSATPGGGGRFNDFSIKPDINSNSVVPAWVAGLMSPSSPEIYRREVEWCYGQAAAGVYRGDTYLYSEDLNLRGREHEISLATCTIHLFGGEYDYVCKASAVEAFAHSIPGAHYTFMEGLGHFAMSENYPAFRRYLYPALAGIDGLEFSNPAN